MSLLLLGNLRCYEIATNLRTGGIPEKVIKWRISCFVPID
jgi:hypothetical protein